MKNIKILFSLMILMALGLGSCNDDLAEPPVALPEGGVGTGYWNNPMTAYQASLGSVNENVYDGEGAWVKGYIVGYVDTNVGNVLKSESASFSTPATVKTNILIAMSPDERNWENCVPVQLPSGDVRNALNLGDNPGNQGKEVCIYGTTGSKYCGAYGVRSVSQYNWGNEGIAPKLPEGAVELTTLKFTTGMQSFTFDQGNPSTAGFEAWKQDSKYGFVATGGRSGSAVTTDALAISRVYDFNGYSTVYVRMRSAANYFNNRETFRQMCQTMVRVVTGDSDNYTYGEWRVLEFKGVPEGNSWTFGNSEYLEVPEGGEKKLQFAFRYTSTTSVSGTWEIDSLTLCGIPQK